MDDASSFALHGHYARAGPGVSNAQVQYSAGYVVLSFVTSFLGCITTLELLQRRTSIRGAYNWFLLVTSAITMGGIGIWAMHFVGNRAIVLEGGEPHRQILYNPGFTAASFFMPIVVLIFAFYLLGITTRARQIYIAVAGVLTGSAVCGMHYLGQLGIENYYCSYRIANVVGAATIAIIASFVALSVFFRLRDTWTDSWWKRLICGGILAVAVSGMHWTAAVGTSYQWKDNLTTRGDPRSSTAIIASGLSMGACVILLAVAFVRGRNKRSARIKAQRLVLACAYFDDDGKLMVTQDGVLPSEKITNHYIEKTFGEDELGRSHATFLWIFKASRNWKTLKCLIPGMREYIETDPAARQYRPSQGLGVHEDDVSELNVDFAPIFKQLFCVAAQHLANNIHEPLEKIGVLFEEALETGAIYVSTRAKRGKTTLEDVETGIQAQAIAKGKYLFLQRQVNKTEIGKFAALGYRFATVGQIGDSLAKSMQVNAEVLASRLRRMESSVSSKRLPPPGVHLACFMLRPSMYKSFDLLVPATAQNQLPSTTVQSDDLSCAQLQMLKRFDERNVGDVLTALVNEATDHDIDHDLRRNLYDALGKLTNAVGDSNTMMRAKFSAREFRVPCQPRDGVLSPHPTCTLLAIRVLSNIHAASAQNTLTYVPLSFFHAQQQLEIMQSGDSEFAQEVWTEFGCSRRTSLGGNDRLSSAKSHTVSSSASCTLAPEHATSSRRKPSLIRFFPVRGSDEASIVEREQSAEDSRVEMTRKGSVSIRRATDASTSRQDSVDTDVTAAANERSSWVMELFGLLRLQTEGWRSTKTEGWKWDIYVDNSFEIGLKHRLPGTQS